jgi:anaphase-promoting complex subunit 4
MLTLLAEKVVPEAIKLDLLTYCPSMDLIALATLDEQVHVFRLNGQKVFSVANKIPDCKILQLEWKPNGNISK